MTPGPTVRQLGVEVALGQLLVLGAERRHDRGDADGVDVVEADPAEREQAGDPLGQLVAGRPGAGLEAPVLDQALAVEGAEVGLGVADVDREQHRAIIAADWLGGQRARFCIGSRRERPPLRDPGLAPEHRRAS